MAKEIKTDNRPELFAATPPLEFIKYLISRCASRQRRARPSRLMIQDISKAYFFAPATRDIFIELPPEEAEPGMVGKLEKSLYGTRDAALNWAEAYTKVLIAMGYKKGLSSPCSFHHKDWDLSTVVHGDDFLTEGPIEGLQKMNTELEKSFQVKTEIIGPDAGQQLEARVLNRVIRWEETGITWEPDPRHAEIMIEQMGLKGGRSLKIPGVKEEKKTDRELRADIDNILSDNEYPEQNKINTEGGCQRKVDGWKESTCGTCHAKFNSRNEMFRHMDQEGHVVDSDGEEENEEHVHRVASGRGQRKITRGARKYNKLIIHRNENIEEVNDIGDWLESHGWKNDMAGHWTIKVNDTLSIPTAPFGFVKSRVVTDSDTGHIVETFLSGPTTKPEQVHRNFRKSRNVHVVLEVYKKKGKELID